MVQTQLFDNPSQFEPLLPEKDLPALRGRAQSIVEASLRLMGKVHPTTIDRLRELLRAMNSYYTNRIEGQGTHPINIERAMRSDYSQKPETAKLQRLALAHIEAEKSIEAHLLQGAMPLSVDFIKVAHREIYSRLPASDRTTPDGIVVEPGVWRARPVRVGVHIPPAADAIAKLLARYEEAYAASRSWDEELIQIACAHHRLAWVHPFLDGNGRAGRLVTHGALFRVTGGLWSVCRGLARRVNEYLARLADADVTPRGSLDGRGTLSEEGLRRWCELFLEICNDQVEFMTRMLNLDDMKARIRALIAFHTHNENRLREEAVLPLHHLYAAGPLTRGEFRQLTGLGERNAQALLSKLLAMGLVETDSPLGPVRFGLPLDALQFLLPGLYPEAAAQVE